MPARSSSSRMSRSLVAFMGLPERGFSPRASVMLARARRNPAKSASASVWWTEKNSASRETSGGLACLSLGGRVCLSWRKRAPLSRIWRRASRISSDGTPCNRVPGLLLAIIVPDDNQTTPPPPRHQRHHEPRRLDLSRARFQLQSAPPARVRRVSQLGFSLTKPIGAAA